MILPSDVVSILERLSDKDSGITDEDILIIENVSSQTERHRAILKLFLAYKILNSKIDKKKQNEVISRIPDLIKDAINSLRELETQLPNLDNFLLEIGVHLLNSKHSGLAKELFKLVRDFSENPSLTNKLSNYFLAYNYFIEAEHEKSARLLEILGSELTDNSFQALCYYKAAIMYYKTNLKRSMNLLENCLSLLQKTNDIHVNNFEISKDQVESTLNNFRREYILRFYNKGGDLFQIIEKLTVSLHKNGLLLELAAAYYEAGTVFDNLDYGDTAEDYFIEGAKLSAEKEEWKLYSKCLIQLIIKFIERGDLENAELYLNDLSIITEYISDENLRKKMETLLISLAKLKIGQHENANIINASTDQIQNILENEIETKPEINFSETVIPQNRTISPENEQEVFNEFLASETSNEENVVSIHRDTIQPEIIKKEENRPSFYNTRQEIIMKLNDRGFETYLDIKPIKGGITVDIVGIKGKIRKKKIYIMLAETLAEGELSANLLRTLKDSAEKIIFIFGEKARKKKKKGISYCFKLNQLVFA